MEVIKICKWSFNLLIIVLTLIEKRKTKHTSPLYDKHKIKIDKKLRILRVDQKITFLLLM